MSEQKVLCRLCGIQCDDIIAEQYHWFKDHWNWYGGIERVRQLKELSLSQLEARQKQIDKFKKDSNKKK